MGVGIEARRASLEGAQDVGLAIERAEGFLRGLWLQKPQIRVGESKPPSTSGMFKLKQQAQQGSPLDMETPGVGGDLVPPTLIGRMPPSSVPVTAQTIWGHSRDFQSSLQPFGLAGDVILILYSFPSITSRSSETVLSEYL